jgi:hypothetical protein
MSSQDSPSREPSSVTRPKKSNIPSGYRQGIITAITVLIGFTLAFFRFWGFEAAGDWTYKSFVAAVGLAIALLLQLIALFRSLRLEDNDETEYRKTTRWFFASAAVLAATLVLAAVVYSGAL